MRVPNVRKRRKHSDYVFHSKISTAIGNMIRHNVRVRMGTRRAIPLTDINPYNFSSLRSYKHSTSPGINLNLTRTINYFPKRTTKFLSLLSVPSKLI